MRRKLSFLKYAPACHQIRNHSLKIFINLEFEIKVFSTLINDDTNKILIRE